MNVMKELEEEREKYEEMEKKWKKSQNELEGLVSSVDSDKRSVSFSLTCKYFLKQFYSKLFSDFCIEK